MRYAVLVAGTITLASCQLSMFEPYFQKAELLFSKNDMPRAVELYLQAIGENAGRPEAYFGLALAYDRMGYLEEAMLALEKTVELDPKNFYAKERLAAVYIDLGHPDSALSLCGDVLRAEKEFAGAFNTLGHAFFALGQIDSAERTFTAAANLCRDLNQRYRTTSNPLPYAADESEAFNGLGEVNISRGLYSHALETFDVAIALTPYWDRPWFNKAIVHEALGNVSAAQVAYQRTIDLAPGNTSAYRSYARLLVKLKRESEAIDLLRRSLRVDSTDVFSYYALGEILERRSNYSDAALMYEGVLRVDADDPNGYLRLARVQLRRNRPEEAIGLFHQAIELNPDFAEAYNGLGEAHRAQGNMMEAQSAFKDAIESDSTLTIALRNLGSLLLEQGKEGEGITFYTRAAMLGDASAQAFLRSRGIEWDKR